MTNLEKYNSAFREVFGVEDMVLDDTFSKEMVKEWDSVHQLNVITVLEEIFDIMFEPEDIMGFTSYRIGRDILMKYEIEL